MRVRLQYDSGASRTRLEIKQKAIRRLKYVWEMCHEEGLSYKDIGALLGVSRRRANHLYLDAAYLRGSWLLSWGSYEGEPD